MNTNAIIALLLSGFALGTAITNIAYSIFFYIESREKRKSSKDGPDNGGNGQIVDYGIRHYTSPPLSAKILPRRRRGGNTERRKRNENL